MANAIVQSFLDLFNDGKAVFRVLDTFPIPVEIFSPDGTAVYINRAFLDLHNIPDANLAVGKYNVLSGPVCSDRLRFSEGIKKAIKGEAVSIMGLKTTVQDLMDHGIIKEKPFEAAFMDVYFSPICGSGEFSFVLCVSVVKNIYRGRPEVAKLMEYINGHLHENFSPKAAAGAVGIGVSQLYKIFKQDTGMTPGEYYKSCKVDRLKEKLGDKSLSIKEVFAACGEDSRGRAAKIFKALTGSSPSAWRQK